MNDYYYFFLQFSPELHANHHVFQVKDNLHQTTTIPFQHSLVYRDHQLLLNHSDTLKKNRHQGDQLTQNLLGLLKKDGTNYFTTTVHLTFSTHNHNLWHIKVRTLYLLWWIFCNWFNALLLLLIFSNHECKVVTEVNIQWFFWSAKMMRWGMNWQGGVRQFRSTRVSGTCRSWLEYCRKLWRLLYIINYN